jgi:hypothetical protein
MPGHNDLGICSLVPHVSSRKKYSQPHSCGILTHSHVKGRGCLIFLTLLEYKFQKGGFGFVLATDVTQTPTTVPSIQLFVEKIKEWFSQYVPAWTPSVYPDEKSTAKPKGKNRQGSSPGPRQMSPPWSQF